MEFGTYFQGEYGERSPIQWRVLDIKQGKALLVSQYILDVQPYYCTDLDDVTWERSDLRDWLNTSFLDNAFSVEEQARIATTSVSADKNPEYSTDPGNPTTDKVFLLSIEEAEQYFSDDESRECVPTAYAERRGHARYWWWLRSPGEYQHRAAVVSPDGAIFCSGMDCDVIHIFVRPALWIDSARDSEGHGPELCDNADTE